MSTAEDFRACAQLRQHGIFSIIGYIVGFDNETFADFRTARRAPARYDGDHLNAMYATPHPWTRFARDVAGRHVAEDDLSRWDYRHQVIEHGTLAPWQLFLAVKWLEFRFHLRLRRLQRLLSNRDPVQRGQLRWCLLRTGLVFLAEMREFMQRTLHRTPRLTVGEFQGRTKGGPPSPGTRPSICDRPPSLAGRASRWGRARCPPPAGGERPEPQCEDAEDTPPRFHRPRDSCRIGQPIQLDGPPQWRMPSSSKCMSGTNGDTASGSPISRPAATSAGSGVQ